MATGSKSKRMSTEDQDNGKLRGNFIFKNDFLYCEDVQISKLQKELEAVLDRPSPFYLFSKKQIIQNIQAYKGPLEKYELKHMLGYAMKANYNPSVLKIMKDTNCIAITVSEMEMRLALDIGFPGKHIVFNGNGKGRTGIELAVQNGCLLNVDSAFDLHLVISVCKRLNKCARLLLRLNPNIDSKVHPFLATGLAASKFGIDNSGLQEVLEVLRKEPCVTLVGMHCHLGSTIDKIDVFRECVDVILSLVETVKKTGFSDIKYLNLGGGLGIDHTKYAARTAHPDVDTKRKKVSIPSPEDLIMSVEGRVRDSGLCLILEPGRSMVANSCLLVTRVLGVKKNDKTNFIVCDGSMNEVIRPCLYSAYHHIELTEPTTLSEENRAQFDVVGPVCECSDFLGKDRYLPYPHEGCGLVIFDTGAYCGSMCSNYNMRPRPAELLVEGNRWKIIRKPDTYQQMMAPYVS